MTSLSPLAIQRESQQYLAVRAPDGCPLHLRRVSERALWRGFKRALRNTERQRCRQATNATNAVSGGDWTRDKDVAGYVNRAGGNIMTINMGDAAFKAGGASFQKVLTHESLHTTGLSDWERGVRAFCCSGQKEHLKHFKSLTPEEQVNNPDHLMRLVW